MNLFISRVAILVLCGLWFSMPASPQTNIIDPWVDAIIDYQAGERSRGVPENLIGPPGAGDPEVNGEFSLDGGFVILDMGFGEEIENGPGVDFIINEGGDNEAYSVFVSNQLDSEWIELGRVTGNSEFDLADFGLEKVRYIRIEDDGHTADGADIESVEAYYYPNDPWIDEVVSYNLNPEWADQLDPPEKDPTHAIGRPDGNVVSLPYSSIVLRFTNNTVIDGEGDDLFISELGSGGESARVWISPNGIDWAEIGIADNASTTSFDLASIGYTQAVVFVRVEGLDAGGSSPGFDLDAIYALPNSIGAPPEPIDEETNLIQINDPDFILVETVAFQAMRPMYPDGFKPLFTDEGDLYIVVADSMAPSSPYTSVVRQRETNPFTRVLNLINASDERQILNMWASRQNQLALLVGPKREWGFPDSKFYLLRISGPFGFTHVSNFGLY
jgi:hypothetical protein